MKRPSAPALLEKAAGLERRVVVELGAGPEITVEADPDQIEQVLINLVKNAADACGEREGAGIRIGWSATADEVRIAIEDDGPGVGDTANLFVPFFTTKSGGSGIGLVLSRQIVEGHEGELSLTSRPERAGAIALVRLPLPP